MHFLQYSEKQLKNRYGNNQTFKCAISLVRTFANANPKIKTIELFDQHALLILDKILKNQRLSTSTKKQLIFVFSLLLRNHNNNSKKLKFFVDAYKKLKNEITEKRKENLPRNFEELQGMKFNLFELRKQYPINFDRMTQSDLLFNLLIHLDETPRLEYRLLKLNPSGDLTKQNYIQCSEQCVIVLNVYKTAKKYGKWEVVVKNKKMNRYLTNYLQRVPDDEYIFVNKKNKMFFLNTVNSFN